MRVTPCRGHAGFLSLGFNVGPVHVCPLMMAIATPGPVCAAHEDPESRCCKPQTQPGRQCIPSYRMEPNGLLRMTHDVISTVTAFIPPPERPALRTAARALVTRVPVSRLRVLLSDGPEWALGGAWVSITRDTPVQTIVFVDDRGRGAHLLEALTVVLPMPHECAQYHTKDRDAAVRVARRFKGRPAITCGRYRVYIRRPRATSEVAR